MPYRIEYSPEVVNHLQILSKHDQVAALDGIDEQLIHTPTVETRNRKPMRPNPVAPWELRIGHIRVYFDVQDTPDPIVTIHAIGVKERDQVRIGTEVFKL